MMSPTGNGKDVTWFSISDTIYCQLIIISHETRKYENINHKTYTVLGVQGSLRSLGTRGNGGHGVTPDDDKTAITLDDYMTEM